MIIRWGTNLLLLILVGILGIWLALKGDNSQILEKSLFPEETKEVDRVMLDHAEHIEFVREAGTWKLVQPFEAPVSQVRVALLLEIRNAVPKADYSLNDDDRKTFGLDPPLAKITIGNTRIEFGSKAPMDASRYAAIGSRLYLIDDQYYRPMQGKPTDFVEKKLLDEGFSIRSITLPGLKVDRGADGKWTSTPAYSEADLSDFVMQWSMARAIEVHRESADRVIGETIEVVGDEGSRQFVILQKGPDLVVARNDLGLSFVVHREAGLRLLNVKVPGDQDSQTDSDSQDGHDSSGSAAAPLSMPGH